MSVPDIVREHEVAQARELHSIRCRDRQRTNGPWPTKEGARDRRVHFPDGSVLTDTGHRARFVDRRSPEDLME